MVLSTGTLNLKFMQRAAARAVKEEPGKAGSAAPSPAPSSPAVSAAPSPAPATPSAPAVVADEAEAAAKWVLPRRAGNNAVAGPSKAPRVQFVASYMPFLDDDESVGGGPGRFSFGMGKKPSAVNAEDGGDVDMASSDDEGGTARRKTPKDLSRGRFFKDTKKSTQADDAAPMARTVSRQDERTPEPEDIPRTFQRPRGFSPSGERPSKAASGKPTKAAVQHSKASSAAASPASAAPSKKAKRRADEHGSDGGPSRSSRAQGGGSDAKAPRRDTEADDSEDDESLSENASRALSIGTSGERDLASSSPEPAPRGARASANGQRTKQKPTGTTKHGEGGKKDKGGLVAKLKAKFGGSSREPSSSPASSRASTPASATSGKKRARDDADTDDSAAKRPRTTGKGSVKGGGKSGGKGGGKPAGGDGLGRTLDERAANIKKQKKKNAGQEAGKAKSVGDSTGARKDLGKGKNKGSKAGRFFS